MTYLILRAEWIANTWGWVSDFLFLFLNRFEKQWIMPPREWSMAKAQLAILFGERFKLAMT